LREFHAVSSVFQKWGVYQQNQHGSFLTPFLENRRNLQKTIENLEKLSRQILFERLPDKRRRKSLPKRVLGLV